MRQPRIRKLRRRGNVEGLVKALGYSDPIPLGGGRQADAGVRVRLEALQALSSVADAEDVAAIDVALSDPDPAVRRLAARVIGEIHPGGAALPLANALVSPGGSEFAEARLEALDVLEGLSKSGKAQIERLIVLAAVDGGPRVAFDQITQDAISGFIADATPQAVSGLVDELIERLPAMNGSLENAQIVLTWLGTHSIEPLMAALDREGGYREPAAAVLGAIRDSRALEPLARVLDDRRADVRRVAVWALGEMRDPRAAEALMRATMDDDYGVRRQAGEALDAMGSIALMAGVANVIRSLEERADDRTVARLVEEGLERTPRSDRSHGHGESGWAPSFVKRIQVRARA